MTYPHVFTQGCQAEIHRFGLFCIFMIRIQEKSFEFRYFLMNAKHAWLLDRLVLTKINLKQIRLNGMFEVDASGAK